jgi:FixJ family two-component response regulator
MPDVTSLVFVVDDDVSVRESLELLIRTAGWEPETFASGQAFLARPRATVPCCLVLDVTLPGLDGLEFLTKPFKDDVLLDAIGIAIERSRGALRLDAEMHALRHCYRSLTSREREVMALVVAGLLNEQVGSELGISEITVKAHRGQVMRKMKADSLPDLVTMAARLGLSPCHYTECRSTSARGLVRTKSWLPWAPAGWARCTAPSTRVSAVRSRSKYCPLRSAPMPIG